jgi:flagellar biosynthetic protein FlhB
MSETDDEKTEEPTSKRLDDARKKGQVAYSREVSNFFMIFTLAIMIIMIFPSMLKGTLSGLQQYFADSGSFEATGKSVTDVGWQALKDSALFLAVPMVLLMLAAITSSFLQNGFLVTSEPIQPKLEKVSPMKGFKRIFSKKSLVEFLKGIIKIIIVGYIAYYAVADDLDLLGKSPQMPMNDMLHYMLTLVMQIMMAVTIAIFFIALADFIFQKLDFMKSMRMSKQEIKEEYKQQEGDPHIKGKLKQIRMEKARKRMMAAVPTADVVITNPTHYAVALKYEENKSAAPLIVALGVDQTALKIKEVAEKHGIPIVRNAPLARGLYDDCDLEEEVPIAHYQSVAEVISYVYRLKGKK